MAKRFKDYSPARKDDSFGSKGDPELDGEARKKLEADVRHKMWERAQERPDLFPQVPWYWRKRSKPP